MANIVLKDIVDKITEASYNPSPFGLKHHKKFYSDGEYAKASGLNGRRMFYDFYAMEMLYSWVGSGSIPSKFKGSPGEESDVQPLPFSQKPINHAQRKAIDEMFEQVTVSVSKRLIDYLKLACIMEFEHILNQGSGWTQFRYNLKDRILNNGGTLSLKEFKEVIDKNLPELSNDISLIKKLIKYEFKYDPNKSYLPNGTYLPDIISHLVPDKKEGEEDYKELPNGPSDKEDKTIPKKMPGLEDEPDPSDEPNNYDGEDKFADEPLSSSEKSKHDPYDYEDSYFKKSIKEGLLTEEKINMNRVRRTWKCMKEVGLTMEDVHRCFMDIEWDSAYGGKKWGTGALALLELSAKHKTEDPEFLRKLIDHIYDLQHNTGSMLNKGAMFVSQADLNRRYKITHIARFIPFCSSPVQKLIAANLSHFTKNPKLELEKPKLILVPKKRLPADLEKTVLDKGWVFRPTDNSYYANIDFKDKEGSQISGIYYEFAYHENGKFTFVDNYKSDIQVFDTWEEALGYFAHLQSQILPTYSGYSQPTPVSTITPAQEYNNNHVSYKLNPDKEKMLLDIAKMGWRKNGNRYKAYFPGSKRLLMYAYTDGIFMVTDEKYSLFRLFSDFGATLNYLKDATKDALPYPDQPQSDAGLTPVTPDKTASDDILNIPHTNDYENHPNKNLHKTIRLSKSDEMKMERLGFVPINVGGDIAYVNKFYGVIRFFSDNTAIYKSPKTASAQITFDSINYALGWLKTKQSKTGNSSSPQFNPSTYTKKPATNAPEKGVKPGTAFESHITAHGFGWDQESGEYKDPKNGSTLHIFPNRTSTLTFSNNEQVKFINLPDLLNYLKKTYDTEAKPLVGNYGQYNESNPTGFNQNVIVEELTPLGFIVDTSNSQFTMTRKNGGIIEAVSGTVGVVYYGIRNISENKFLTLKFSEWADVITFLKTPKQDNGPMPFSNTHYSSHEDNGPLTLEFADAQTLADIGFNYVQVGWSKYYTNGQEAIIFYDGGSALYWKDINSQEFETRTRATIGFDSVKQGMEYLWNTHEKIKGNINESINYKSLIKSMLY